MQTTSENQDLDLGGEGRLFWTSDWKDVQFVFRVFSQHITDCWRQCVSAVGPAADSETNEDVAAGSIVGFRTFQVHDLLSSHDHNYFWQILPIIKNKQIFLTHCKYVMSKALNFRKL